VFYSEIFNLQKTIESLFKEIQNKLSFHFAGKHYALPQTLLKLAGF